MLDVPLAAPCATHRVNSLDEVDVPTKPPVSDEVERTSPAASQSTKTVPALLEPPAKPPDCDEVETTAPDAAQSSKRLFAPPVWPMKPPDCEEL